MPVHIIVVFIFGHGSETAALFLSAAAREKLLERVRSTESDIGCITIYDRSAGTLQQISFYHFERWPSIWVKGTS